MANQDNIQDILENTLFSEADIHEMCTRLGKQLTEEYAGKEPVLVGALTGAIYFMTDLSRQMDVKCKMDFIDVSSYGNGTESSGKVKLVKDVSTDVKGKDVLIIEDIVDTGHTLKFMKDHFMELGARSVKCAALLNKPSRRVDDVTVDFYGSEVGNQFVVGYGLDFYGMYRNIPFIGIVKPEVIQAYANK
ncbi:hypoxanthine phosphoribosyltransferase [Lactobacillus psittaci]|uniref:Hypoxanthine phosphoribosyltransferase n=1 Tax=Lactobacillus psittaci DSM 15354 TaxID=1122152 RepID=A0A0R1S4J5_9LACO|nr:hypoxanthine phosphoribosyltransferase [Lactobacillus psittaci]KRL63825.1 hypoxanthine phosphoribosyltransferase [Lactobacillus psittaci DSM 15354]